MTDSGPVRPRRALDPLPHEELDTAPGGGRRGLRGRSHDPGRALNDVDTQVLRRVILPDSPRSPDSPPTARVWTPTPVPPPRPVLPESTTQPVSAGRRFSASESPREFLTAAPRRSATSVASPPEHLFVAAGPGPARSDGPSAPPVRATARTRRSGRRALIVLAAVAVVGLGIGGVHWLAPTSPAALTPSSPPPSPSLDPLLGPGDLSALGTTTWVTAAAAPDGGDGNPVCLPITSDALPTADRTDRRVLTPESGTIQYVNHVVDTYPDRATATRAFTERLLQAGSCADTDALIIAAQDVTGLADDAFVTEIEVQSATSENHTVLVSQTGRNVSLIDIASPKPIAAELATAVAAGPLGRLCSGGQGACPTAPALVPSIPAAGQNPGWLIEADLPRITPGAGRWAASRPSSELGIVGSQCEQVTLTKVEGVTASAQRTLLLADDPAAPTVFGVDQVVYSFPDAKAAKSFADKLGDNLAGCADAVPTATVEKGPTVKGDGAAGASFSGRSFLVTQQTGAGDSATYRVGVVRIAERVTYLLANPAKDFDFTDTQWQAILQRAGERVSQMP